MDLFGGTLPPAVQAPEHSTQLADLARALGPHFRAGTSSWSFPGWQDIVYKRKHEASALSHHGLHAYGAHPLLRTVGVDRTFYGPVTSEVFAGWAAQVPPDFRFLVKCWDRITTAQFAKHPRYGALSGKQNPDFLNAKLTNDRVIEPMIEGLGDKLGVLLVQLPPTPVWAVDGADAFAQRLDDFLGALLPGVPVAVELRTAGLLSDAYADVLVQHGARHCYVSHPSMPTISEQLRRVRGGARNGLVIRWMLRRDLSYDAAKAQFAPFHRLASPDPETRSEAARLVDLALGRDKEVLVIANNKAEGSSPLTVQALCEAIVHRRAPSI